MLWNPGTGQPISKPVPVGSGVSALAFSPDGKLLAVGVESGRARLWDWATGQPVGPSIPADTQGGGVSTITFNSDGTDLTITTDDQTTQQWDPYTARPVGNSVPDDTDSTDQQVIVVSDSSGTRLEVEAQDGRGPVWLWNPVTGKPTGSALPAGKGSALVLSSAGVHTMAVSPNGKLLATLDDLAGRLPGLGRRRSRRAA